MLNDVDDMRDRRRPKMTWKWDRGEGCGYIDV